MARNRAKRLLREAARHLYPLFESGWDVMLVARAGILKVKEPRVAEALDLLLKRAGLKERRRLHSQQAGGSHSAPPGLGVDGM